MPFDETFNQLVTQLREPLPRNLEESRDRPGVLYSTLYALREFTSILPKQPEKISTDSVQAASDCIEAIIKSDQTGNTDKKEAVQRYVTLVRHRPEDLSSQSLKSIFACIEKETWIGDNSQKWGGVLSDLNRELRDLRIGIAETGYTPQGVSAESSSTLGDFVFTGLMTKIIDDKDSYGQEKAIEYYKELVTQNDGRINQDNIKITSAAMQARLQSAITYSFMYPEAEGKAVELNQNLTQAIDTFNSEPGNQDRCAKTLPTLLIESLTKAVMDPQTSNESLQANGRHALALIDRYVGIPGEARFGVIKYEAIADLHTAIVEQPNLDETTSNLADRIWRRALTGHVKAPIANP